MSTPATRTDVSPTAPITGAQPSMRGCFEDMRLTVGASLQFELTHLKTARNSVRLIGWAKGQGVIVTLPTHAAAGFTPKEGDLVLLRAFTGKTAFAFRASVLRVASHPYPHLHLTYPESVEGVAVRRSPRCRTNLAGTVTTGEASGLPATVLNLSLHGALIETAECLGGSPTTLQLALTLPLHDTDVSLNLHAAVVSYKSEAAGGPHNAHRYALHFPDLASADRLALGGYVFFQIYENPANVA